ncbi:hypothetical protein RHSIM_Rhsim05G0221400 [Rhododendron simsii]|uniref:Uncharacterized protein n=1 Tax=Rhododendron simsii TaxID=118357 RepID=A0A834GXC8_RHOSS|nr:hypothetical protein RHSIM_Rhsim05G0221400 [Rhododendron simsii]
MDNSSTLFSLRYLETLNLAYNRLNSSLIPSNIGDLTNLSNRLSGTIPQCLIEKCTETLGILNLGDNSLFGHIPGTFPQGCALKTLALNRNHLEGQVPKSLSNCANLEVLNFGNNKMNGNFTCFLKNLSNLRVLVLRSNDFQGDIHCPGANNGSWPNLQIIDVSLNNFSGDLPSECFLHWNAMMIDRRQSNCNHKGREIELVKILSLFIAVDFSSNSFKGEIPHTIGALSSLYVLNLSRNALSGQIPSRLGNLTQLESLDLSVNKLNGSIPLTLARLTFLSVLNLSYNHLVGRIPTSTQLQSFSNTSFEGNVGLCGLPLSNSCDTPRVRVRNGSRVCCGALVFWKQGSRWCDEQIEKFVSMIGPTLCVIFSWCGGVKVETDSTIEEHETGDSDDGEDGEEMEEEALPGRYCLFCSKLDIHRKKAVHDPNCGCHGSPPISSPLTSFSSSSSS